MLIGMLQGKSSSASGTSVSQPTSLTKSTTLDPPPRSSTPLADRARALPTPKVVADTPSTTVSTVDSSGRVPHCRPEYLGSFNGQAEELEILTRTVNSPLESRPGLADGCRSCFATRHGGRSLCLAHRPPRRRSQDDDDPANLWNTETEGASAYYFTKLRLLRAAYGNDQSEANLAVDILDGLPATFRVMLRIPRRNPTLKDIRQEISARAPDWKELYAASQVRTSLPLRPAPPAAHLPAKPSSNPPAQGHRPTPSGSGGGTPSAATGSSNPSSGQGSARLWDFTTITTIASYDYERL
ncbi:hypothetical protein A4X06_0g9914 [Tilletia controversa]|uniref:Uncharacterized protein n=1 Tax=Tilletia controversa TaxID=13291 RepID=A0A8X7SRV3_9BASI|nr:hypothetical protein A4X06_0g9914 [Tilletia controversa]